MLLILLRDLLRLRDKQLEQVSQGVTRRPRKAQSKAASD
jgi:hypothetical protein